MPRVMFLTLGLDLGGQSVHIANLATGLIERGWTCSVATPDVAAGAPLGREYFESRGIPVIEVPFSSPRPSGIRRQIAGIRALRDLIGDLCPDVVHVHSVSLAPVARVASRGRHPGPGLVSTFNNEYISDRRRWAARLSATARWPKHPFGHRVIAISEALRASIVTGLGVPQSVVRTIDSAVDDARFRLPTREERRAARDVFGVSDSETLVCCVARVEPRKNQQALIGAVAELARDGRDVRLLLAGPDVDGHTEHLRDLATKAGVTDRVCFAGFVDPRLAYWASDVNALVSVSEGFGLVVIEGMLCGTLSVRSDTAGASDQICDGETGYLVQELTASGIALAIRRALDDHDGAARIRLAASEFVRSRYGMARMAAQVEAIYDEASAIGNPSGRVRAQPDSRNTD